MCATHKTTTNIDSFLSLCMYSISYNKGPCNWEQYKQQYLGQCALRLILYWQNSSIILLLCQETLPHIKWELSLSLGSFLRTEESYKKFPLKKTVA